MIYVIGGYKNFTRWEPVNTVYMFDPEANRWYCRSRMPTPRDNLGIGVRGNNLYDAIGGRINGDYSKNLSVNERYSADTDRWETKAPMPASRSGIAVASWGGEVYVFGGESTEGTFNAVEEYDPVDDYWQTLTPMPTARHGLGAAIVDDRICLLEGGPKPGGSYSGVNEVFTP